MMSIFGKSSKAKQGYFFFEKESSWIVEDDLIQVSVSIDPNCSYDDNWLSGCFLWNKPCVTVTIENKSFDMLYIDLAQCFLSRNKRAQMFWDNSQKITAVGSNTGASLNMGALADAVGVGGVLGTLADGVTIGSGNSTTTATVTQAERVMRIPPMSEEKISIPVYSEKLGGKFGVKEKIRSLPWSGVYLYYLNPRIQEKESIKYSKVDTPLNFIVYITYSEVEDFTKKRSANIMFWADELVGVKQMIGGKKSLPEVESYGYDLNIPHIMVRFEDE